jgi:hypothetical protein
MFLEHYKSRFFNRFSIVTRLVKDIKNNIFLFIFMVLKISLGLEFKIIPPYCIDQNVGNATDAFREGWGRGGMGIHCGSKRKEITQMEKKLLRRH